MISSKKFYGLLLALLVTAMLLSACGSSTPTKAPEATKAPATTAPVATTAPAAPPATTAPAATTAASSQFKPFSSTEGAFSVLLPGTPTANKQTSTVANTNVNIYSFQTEVSAASAVYFVAYNDYPADLVKQQSPQTILANTRDGQLNSIQAKIINEKEISQGPIPGKEYEASSASKYLKARIFLAANRLYQLFALYPAGQQLATDIQTFLDSFKITSSTPAPAASSASDIDNVLSSLQEIQVDPAVTSAFAALPGVTNLYVKMFVSDDSAEKIATTLEASFFTVGYKFSIPGATSLKKVGENSFGGLYATPGQPDILLGATTLVPNFDQTVKNLDELNIPGLTQADLQKFFGQLSGKKSLIIVVSGNGVSKAMLNS